MRKILAALFCAFSLLMAVSASTETGSYSVESTDTGVGAASGDTSSYVFTISSYMIPPAEGITYEQEEIPPEDDDDTPRRNPGGGGGGGGTGTVTGVSDSASMTWLNIKSGQEIAFRINKTAIAVSNIHFVLNADKPQVTFTARRISTLPVQGVDSAYQYLELKPAGAAGDDFSDIMIEFSVDKGWLANNSLASNEIVMLRYTAAWAEIPTSLADEDTRYAHYTAHSPGFSYFAVAAKRQQAANQSIPEPGVPLLTEPQQPQQPGPTGNIVSPPVDKVAEKSQDGIPILFYIVAGSLIALTISAFLFYRLKTSGAGNTKANAKFTLTDEDSQIDALEQLESYIQAQQKDDKSTQKIIEDLCKIGWKESIIDLVIHEVHKPHDQIEKLVSYVLHAKRCGYSREQIVSYLKKVGWPDEDIDFAFRSID